MTDLRAEAYLTLIEQLLNCSNEEEFRKVLSDNQALLDEGLVKTFAQVAQLFAERGEEETAQRCLEMANWMVQALEMTDNPQDYLEFLRQVIRATYESNGNPEVVYPLLLNNTDKLNAQFAQILYQWATNLFLTLKPEEASIVAAVIVEFGNLIAQFPLGYRGSNLEIAIASYRAALEVRTREAFPVDWASTQNNLGNAYFNRIVGEKAENLEMAIASYRAALEVYTREAFPVQWAGTQNNLGAAYSDRIVGERAENLEMAIASYHTVLEVRTREAFPYEWAKTQNNLGAAYYNRIQGEKIENLKRAIEAYRNTLTVLTRDSYPSEWVETVTNLGTAFYERFSLVGDIQDLEQVIKAYQNALDFYQNLPYEKHFLALTLLVLGKALAKRGYYSQAIEKLENARILWQQLKDLANLAVTLFELASLYHRTGLLEQARLYHKDSLRLFRRLQDENSEAAAMTALGNLEMQIGRLEEAKIHLTEARQYYQENHKNQQLQEVNKLLEFLLQAHDELFITV